MSEPFHNMPTPPGFMPGVFVAALASVALALVVLGVSRGVPLHSAWPLWSLIGAPVVEEIVFRAGLHESLLRAFDATAAPMPRWVANVVCAVTFASLHLLAYPGLTGLATFAPALAIGALYERQRRVWPCIALHALFNVIGLLLATVAH